MTDKQPVNLKDYQQAKRWLKEHKNDVFPTYESFYRFLKKHRVALCATGQLFLWKGRKGYYVGPNIEAEVMKIVIQEAIK